MELIYKVIITEINFLTPCDILWSPGSVEKNILPKKVALNRFKKLIPFASIMIFYYYLYPKLHF